MEKEIHLSNLAPRAAAQLLAGVERTDPKGQAKQADVNAIAARGRCFMAQTANSVAVYVVQTRNGQAWVSACKGWGPTNWTNVLLPVIERQAAGCESVGFQTSRRGLVRSAEKQGYEVTGWILRKKLK